MIFLKYIQSVALFLMLLIISLPIIHADNLNLIYDGNGNLITGDSFYREYDEFNQLVRIRSGNLSNWQILEEFVWHPVEERVLIKDVFSNGVNNYSVYYVSKEYVLIENSTGNYTEKYVYQDGILVAQVDTDGNKQAVHNDHLGSVSLITDSNGNIIENTFYSPFGEILEGGDKSRFDYEGKEFDSLTQDYDFHFRKIKPNIPVFNQPDTLIQNVYDPQSLNRYMFERGNPYKYVDPDGHGKITFLIKKAEKLLHKFFPFMKDFAISESVSKFTDKKKEKYEETIPEEEQSQLVEDIYQITRFGEDVTDVTQGGMVLKAKTRHVYLRKSYKFLDDVSDAGIAVDFVLAGYYWYKTKTYEPKFDIQNQEKKRQEIIAQAKAGTYSGGAGYNEETGAYVTDDGHVYPTSNPNWVPCGCATNE